MLFSPLSVRIAITVLIACSTAPGQNVFASRVVAFQDNGQLGGGIFNPPNALGSPDGSVHTLGIGGSITLGFDVVIVDGPGADLIVSENSFASLAAPWSTFAETCFVEVSSDGARFARVPTRYTGPQVDPGPFAFVHGGWYAGFGGVFPVHVGATDRQDLVASGGDGIDVADLATDPLVVSGAVDLNAITHVRLVDVRSGIDRDAQGILVRDPGAGSADIDAVTIIHHAANLNPRGPSVTIDMPASGRFSVTITDPDGISDIDPAGFGFALWGVPVQPSDLFAITMPARVSPTSFTVTLRGGGLPPGLPLQIAVALQDFAGNRSGAARARP